ncbi:cytotoxic T-lymphocyte protein 4-like [Hyperolius riggenbachi]|uniref:cytotoxic T-lymphocyte protein 4-like n=1 Tax=Hyperolius riggenbachi TaxID=752182 RepID=UPI0035A3A918
MYIPVLIGIIYLHISASRGNLVIQPAVVVASRHGEATLVCDYKVKGVEEEIRFSLLKKMDNHETEICVLSFSPEYKSAKSGKTIKCVGTPSPYNVTFQISGLQTEDTGLYSCKMEIMYPPPYRTTEGTATLIYVSDLSSQCAQSLEPNEPQTQSYEYVFFIIFLCMLLYSVLVTIVLVLKLRKRRWDTGYYGQALQSKHKNYQPYYIRI